MRVQEAPESGQLFEWRSIRFAQIEADRYQVTADCVVLVDGTDPRNLSLLVLNEAFQIGEGDKAEFTWTVDIDAAEHPMHGDVFTIFADVTITDINEKDVLLQSKRMIQSLMRALEDVDSAFTDIGISSGVPEELIRFASLNGLCAGIRSQLNLVLSILTHSSGTD